MLEVGVTGGIGSGKSTVCRIFELLGVPVYNSDLRGRFLTDHDSSVKSEITKLFGKDVFNSESLDRKKVGSIVFNNKELLNSLNNIIHPAVKKDYEKWLSDFKNEKFVIKESALLFEIDAVKSLDKIILVYAPVDLRIKRVMQRDDVAEQHVIDRIKNQMDDNVKINKSDFVIYCDEKNLVIDQVLKIYNELNKI